ncbi:MAG: PAS domain S-box protein [Sideroxydans sp.]|nr:PAS domain S-box protein [Sideroxydans sp.]
MRLIDIATRDVTTGSAQSSLAAAASVMAQQRYSSIVVTDDSQHPLGIITERNILRAMHDGVAETAPLREVMSAPVVVMSGELGVLDGFHTCQREGIRHLVLVDKAGAVAGVISETDFRLHLDLTILAGRRRISSIAQRAGIALPPETPLKQAIDLMHAQHKSCVVVVAEGKPLGIVTERDVVRLYSSNTDWLHTTLGDVMVSPVLSIPVGATTNQAAEQMLVHKVRHLVVVDEKGSMSGLVSEHDLTQLMVTGLHEQRAGIEESFLHTLLDTIPDLVWLKDAEGRYLACNHRFERFFGAVEKDIVGKTDYDFVDRATADAFREQDRMAMAAGKHSVNEEWITFADDGHRELVETIKTPMRGRSGKLVGVLGVARDFTERKKSHQQLELLESAVNASSDAIFLIDGELRFHYVNETACRRLGYTREALLSMSVTDIDPDTSRAQVQQMFAETKFGEESIVETRHRARDGHLIEVEVSASKVRFEERILSLCIVRDITERKKARQRLQLLERAVNTSADAVFLLNEEAGFSYVNETACRQLGYPHEVLLGMTVGDIDPDISNAQAQAMIRGSNRGESNVFESRHRTCDGKLLDVEIAFTIIEFDKVRYSLCIVRDITERNLAEQRLRESEQRLKQSEELLRTVIEAIPDAIQFKDGEGRWLTSNSAARAAFGLSETTVCGSTDAELSVLAPAEYKAPLLKCRDTDQQVWQQGIASRVEEVIWDEHGVSHAFDVIKVPLFHEDGSRKGLVIVGREVSELKRAEEALRATLDEYAGLVQRIPVGVYKFRMLAQGGSRYDYVSHRWCELLDVEEKDVMRDPKSALSRILPDEQEEFMWLQDVAREQMHAFEWEGRIRRRNGEIRWLHIASQPTRLENGDVLWDGIQYDITDRRRAEESLRVNASVFDNSQEAIIVTDANNLIIDVNTAFTSITGYSRAEVLGRDPNILNSGRQDKTFYEAMWQILKERGAWRGEIWNRRKSGEVFAEMLSISVIADHHGQVQRYVGIFSDITYFKEHEAELSRVANYDALTGVANRRLLADRLRQAIAVAQRGDTMLAVCYIDLDGFKDVNDKHGHDMGDKLLIDITRRLQDVLRAGDTLARLGGDEFVMLFNELPKVEECYRVLERVMEVISQPVVLKDRQVVVSASIGVTLYPEDDADGDTLLRHADQAMYIAKQSGKNRFHLYDAMHDKHVRTLHEGRRRIAEGLEAGEFELYYQPRLELSSGKIVGVEALIRWNHPERGMLAPAEFLPIIENSEQDVQLGKWVIRNALAQLFAWERAGLYLQVSINISAQHLQIADFAEHLQSELTHYPTLRDGALQIEVLESAALEDIAQTSEVIDACRKMGVTFALDDFGTGYSSLVYLSKLSADTLKIDQSFVQGMSLNAGDRAIVQGVIALADTFGRHTVAEGVEDGELNAQLKKMGCGSVQGYSIAQPMPAGEIPGWIKQHKASVV